MAGESANESSPSLTPNPLQLVKDLERKRDEATLLALLRPEVNSTLTRRAAAKALAKIARPDSVSELVEYLSKETDRLVRLELVGALGKLGDDRGLEVLLNALKDREAVVRREAATALSRYNSPAAFEALLTALRQNSEAGDRLIRQFAAEALGQLADRRAVPALLEALKDEEGLVRAAAARSLGLLGDRAAIPALRRARHTTPHVTGADCAECQAIDQALENLKI
jgi:HEAT repeat protein